MVRLCKRFRCISGMVHCMDDQLSEFANAVGDNNKHSVRFRSAT